MKKQSISIFTIFLVIITISLILYIYWPVITYLFSQLYNSEDYNFGLLLPLVSGYIVFLKWNDIKECTWQPSWWGLLIIVIGMGLFFLGQMAADLFVPRLSLIIVIGGIIWLMGGWQVFRHFTFPLLLMFLMIPLPGFVIRQTTIPLQMVSSKLAAFFLQSLGVPLIRHGNIIDLGVRQLQVVEACSGLRYILALLSLGVIFCFFYQRQLWKAFLILLMVIPAAILANALRVAGMGLYPALQKGFLHNLTGWLIFVFCFICLFFFNKVLNIISPPVVSSDHREVSRKETPGRKGRELNTFHIPHLIAAILMALVTGFLTSSFTEALPVMPRQPLAKFPMKLGSWEGRHLPVGEEVFKVLRSDDYLNAEYSNPGGSVVSLWIDYYKNQQTSHGVHSPFACLQGAGGTILHSEKREIAPGYPVNSLVMDIAGNRMLVYYWFIQRGRWMTSEYWGKFHMGFDRLFKRRADGALIRLITPIDSTVDSSRERLTAFAVQILAILPQYLVWEPHKID